MKTVHLSLSRVWEAILRVLASPNKGGVPPHSRVLKKDEGRPGGEQKRRRTQPVDMELVHCGKMQTGRSGPSVKD